MHSEFLLTQLRTHLLDRVPHMRRSTYAESIEVGALQPTGFPIVFRWRDGSVFRKQMTLTSVLGSTNLSPDAIRQRCDPCRVRKELVAEVLQFKGL